MTLEKKIRKEIKLSYKKYGCEFIPSSFGSDGTCSTSTEENHGIIEVKINCDFPDVGFNLSRIILEIQRRFTEMGLVILKEQFIDETFYAFTLVPWMLMD